MQNGLLPIHHAAQEGQEEVVKLLIEKFNISVNATSNVSYDIQHALIN